MDNNNLNENGAAAKTMHNFHRDWNVYCLLGVCGEEFAKLTMFFVLQSTIFIVLAKL